MDRAQQPHAAERFFQFGNVQLFADAEALIGKVNLFEQHLNFCDGCDWYVDQMRTTAESVGRVREEDIPDDARERLMSAFRDWRRS